MGARRPAVVARIRISPGVNRRYARRAPSVTVGRASANPDYREGLYAEQDGPLALVFDNTFVVDSQILSSVANAGARVTADGTVYFPVTGGTQTDLGRARNGTFDLFLCGEAPAYGSITHSWMNGPNLYVSAFNDKLEQVLFRVPVATGTPATAINLASARPLRPPGRSRPVARL